MIVVSDASPLITLAKIGRLELLPQLYQTIAITPQVYDEVAVKGSGLPGSAEVAASKWITVKPVHNPDDLATEQRKFGLAIGELSAIVLGRELSAGLVLIDEIKARKAAQDRGLAVLGCVGVLESAFRLRLLPDLRHAYAQLLGSGAYVDPKIVESSLKAMKLPPL